jgi:hypothetical protein
MLILLGILSGVASGILRRPWMSQTAMAFCVFEIAMAGGLIVLVML